MSFRFSLSQGKWTEELHYRCEALGFIGCPVDQHFIASGGKKPVEGPAESSQHHVVKIPCPHSQCFTGIKILPWIGCPESSNIQKSFVDNCQGVAHGFLSGFMYLKLKLLTGPELVWHCYHRLKPGCRILNHHRNNPVEPHRHVVKSLGMGLNNGNIGVDVRSHFGFGFESHHVVALLPYCADLLKHRT